VWVTTQADTRFKGGAANCTFRVNLRVLTRSVQFTALIAPYICGVFRAVESETTHA